MTKECYLGNKYASFDILNYFIDMKRMNAIGGRLPEKGSEV